MILDFVTNAIDGEYRQSDEDRIKSTYKEASIETQHAIDMIFICLCGWSMATILNKSYEKDIMEGI